MRNLFLFWSSASPSIFAEIGLIAFEVYAVGIKELHPVILFEFGLTSRTLIFEHGTSLGCLGIPATHSLILAPCPLLSAISIVASHGTPFIACTIETSLHRLSLICWNLYI